MVDFALGVAIPKRVLLVEDEHGARHLAVEALRDGQFRVTETSDGPSALRALEREQFDIVLLDLGVPGLNGFDLLRAIRGKYEVPVIVVTGRGAEADRVLGLELGADDYIVKPCFPRELASRVRTVLRRAEGSPRTMKRLEYDGLVIDVMSRDVSVNGAQVVLTSREFSLLAFLAASPRRVFSRQQLLVNVWGSSDEWQNPATVTEHVRRLRTKIEMDAESPRWIKTVRGAGYRFDP